MNPKVFLGSSKESLDLIKAIQVRLSSVAVLKRWDEGVFHAGDYVLERLIRIVKEYDFAIFALVPEDFAQIRGQRVLIARDNVLFEAGLFFSQLDRSRTLLVVPAKSQKDELDFHLPTDLAGLLNIQYTQPAVQKELPPDIGAKCVEIENIIRSHADEKGELHIYDSRNDFDSSHFSGRGNHKAWDKDDKPITPKGEGTLFFEPGGILYVKRKNTEGRFEIFLRPKGPDAPIVTKEVIPMRKVGLSCEAKTENGTVHNLRFVFKDEVGKKLNDQWAQISTGDWERIELTFQLSPLVDWTFRIDDEVISATPGAVKIRNLTLMQRPPG